MGRLFLATPHYILPIRSSEPEDQQQPPATQPNPTAWRLFKILYRWLTAMMSIGMVVFLLVGRHFKLLPELEDTASVVFFLFIALIPVGSGFMITQGDIETHSVTAQQGEHQHL